MALPYYYDEQIKCYIKQFLAIFTGLQVKVGKRDDADEKLISVPIRYGDIDRIVGWIKGDFTQNKPLRLPVMSSVYNEIRLTPELRKGVGQQRRNTYMPTGGLFPDDFQSVHQLMPVPFKLGMEVAIYSSNTDQELQIMEQLLVLFDPILQIQTNDNVFDWAKITTVELENISVENNYPIGSDRRIKIIKMAFSLPIYLSIPANVREDFVKTIFLRLGAIDSTSNTSEEIIADLDAQGLTYKEIFSLEDIDLNTTP